MDNRCLICFDLETSSKLTENAQVLQIAAIAIDGNNLKIKDEFTSLVKPEDESTMEEEALKVNRLNIEELREAPSIDLVFPLFAKWVQKFNSNAQKNTFGAPIACGYNISGYDIPIINRYCKRFGYYDSKWGNSTLFNPIFVFDVMQHMWFWTRTNAEIKGNKLTDLLRYMGVSAEEIESNAHQALWDTRKCGEVAIKLLKMGMYLTETRGEQRRRLEIKGCLNGN